MITSTSNSQIKNITALLRKSSERKKQGLYVVEGVRMFQEIPRDRLQGIYATEDFVKNNGGLLKKHKYELVSDRVFEQMSDTKTPQGILAIVRKNEYTLEDCLTTDRQPLLVLLENLQDPGNLGTILRTAEGAGATGIIMSGDTVDIYNPKVIRSTMGSLYRMPFIYTDNLVEMAEDLKARGITLYAAHLRESTNYFSEDYTSACGIMIGNEGNGLSNVLTSKADFLVKIPMAGRVESLNAAVSTAVILYEAARQRAQNLTK